MKQVVKLQTLRPSKIIAIKYAREILALVIKMIRDYHEIVTTYREKKYQIAGDSPTWLTTEIEARLKSLGSEWEQRFKEFAESKSPEFVNKILRQSDLQIKSALKNYMSAESFTLFGDSLSTQVKQIVKANIAENVALIKSIQSQYSERISGDVYRAITGRGTLKDLIRTIKSGGNITMRRAKLIAGDQTRKVFTTITSAKLNQYGVTQYEWVHTNAGKTYRDYHKRKWDGHSGLRNGHPNGLNGFIFDINRPPIINEKTGERGLPAQLPFCHCVMRPVLVLKK